MCGIPEFLRQRHRVGKRLVALPVPPALTCAVSASRSPFSGRTTCFEFNLPPTRLVFRLHGANANAIAAARTSGRHEQLLRVSARANRLSTDGWYSDVTYYRKLLNSTSCMYVLSVPLIDVVSMNSVTLSNMEINSDYMPRILLGAGEQIRPTGGVSKPV